MRAYVCITENNDFDDDVLPSSLIDMVAEKCTICDGGGDDFDYVDSVPCSDEIREEERSDFLMTVNACKEFKDRCVICHSSSSDNNNSTSAPTI